MSMNIVPVGSSPSGGGIGGASSLTTAGAVPFVASSGVLTQDPYFTYTQVPGSPVAGNTFFREQLGGSVALNSAFTTNMQAEHAIRRQITTLTIDDTDEFGYVAGYFADLEIKPSVDWGATLFYDAYGALVNVESPASLANSINGLHGGYFQVTSGGSDVVYTVSGLDITANQSGSGVVSNLYGINTQSVTNGGKTSTTHTGIKNLASNSGTVTDIIGFDNHISNGGTATNLYGIRNSLDFMAGSPSSTWGISDETGWPSRLLGKVAIGESNSAAPGNTLVVYDATASTGSTKASVRAGAGQSGNLFEVQNNAGTALASLSSVGSLTIPAVTNGTGLAHGTYTPTLTNTTNVAASTARLCTYLRVGNTVTVAGQFDIDPTAPAAATLLEISLPVVSNFSTAYQAGGTAAATGIAGQSAGIEANAANDTVSVKFISADVTNQPMTFQFTYQVI